MSINQNSIAFKKGIRVGQVILKWEGDFRSDKFIKAKIKDLDGELKTIVFYPEGDKVFNIPQYVFDKEYFEKNRDECLEWFGIKQ